MLLSLLAKSYSKIGFQCYDKKQIGINLHADKMIDIPKVSNISNND